MSTCRHREQSEEFVLYFGSLLATRKSQGCFGSLKFTDQLIRTLVRTLMVVIAIAGINSTALAKEGYKFDPSSSNVGFTVHQFLGTTRGRFTNFAGRIEVDREHP